MDYTVRVATKEDARYIHDIYEYYVDYTNITFSIDNETVEQYEYKIEETEKVYPFIVAESDGVILGFAYGGKLRPHDAYRYAVEATIYLSKDAPKRCGIGSALYRKLIDILKRQGFKLVYGVVTDSNIASIELHKSLGFKEVGRFNKIGYKNNSWQGIVWMEKVIGERSARGNTIIPFKDIKKTIQ